MSFLCLSHNWTGAELPAGEQKHIPLQPRPLNTHKNHRDPKIKWLTKMRMKQSVCDKDERREAVPVLSFKYRKRDYIRFYIHKNAEKMM